MKKKTCCILTALAIFAVIAVIAIAPATSEIMKGGALKTNALITPLFQTKNPYIKNRSRLP